MNPAAWHQMKLILEEALAQTQDGRRQYVARACEGDAELRRVVDSLLDEADADTRGFLESPPALPPILREPASPWIGRCVGAHRIVRRLAVGGMGEVFLAQREKGATGIDEWQVAAKVMRGDFDSPALRRRFEQEQQLHARLDHPAIARLLDHGECEGQPYMLFEHVEGEPIDAYCRRRRLGVRQRIALFIEVCAAVAHVHAQCIVHCDIKPANLLVTPDGRPKLLDFGIAETLWPAEAGAGPRTSMVHLEGVAMFTPECAAPEQLRNGTLSQATDIYGLGLLLYRLLTGRMPHEAYRSGLTLPRLRSICENDPVAASTLVERNGIDEGLGLPERDQMARLLHGDLDRILLRSLARDPADRHASAAHLADDLRGYLNAASMRTRQRAAARAGAMVGFMRPGRGAGRRQPSCAASG